MAVIGIDLGGTKVAAAAFDLDGNILVKESLLLEGRSGNAVGELVTDLIKSFALKFQIEAVGICVPGIVYSKRKTVWAPNIGGWENFPLYSYVSDGLSDSRVKIFIESDRTCYILGEKWKGAARGCSDAIYLAVGTGIGAGILIDGRILHGANDIVGATGWMALEPPYNKEFDRCGCFETYASGDGIGACARRLLAAEKRTDHCCAAENRFYKSRLRNKAVKDITSHDVFDAYSSEPQDPVAVEVIAKAVQMWGMASANLVSLFNPERIIFGGGVFGPAAELIPEIYKEAGKWGQPISMRDVKFLPSALGNDAAVTGAAYLAIYNSDKTDN